MMTDLEDVESHFAFGENWAAYAESIGEEEIGEAERGLLKLLDRDEIEGRSFADIGCGSGLHALAALRLGARSINAFDIDKNSVATARALLTRHAAGASWSVTEKSVFELDPAEHGPYDIVYSWGVLHHTGNLDKALRNATALVGNNGLFVIALYRRTTLDPFWIAEKKWYMRASPNAQKRAQTAYRAALRLGMAMSGRNFSEYVENYRSRRGMDLDHDIHDWLGGYPYEAILEPEVDDFLTRMDFEKSRSIARPKTFGLLGSGCDEYVYRKNS